MADLDKLVVQLETNSSSAVSGIDALATSLGKLKSATSGGLGLSAVAKNMDKIKSSLSGIGKIGNDTQGLTKAILTLKQLGGIKVSASIGNQIKNIGESLSKLQIGDGASKITELVSALKPLETLGKSNLPSVANALDKLPKALANIDTRQLYTQIQSLTRIMKPLADEMQKVANGFNAFPKRIQKLIQENEKLTQSNDKTGTSYVNLWAKCKMAYNVIKTGAKTIAGFVNKSNDYIENVNLFNVSMGKYAGEARQYAEEVGEVMGIDPGEWMRNQGVFMTLATGFGVAGDRANKMSKNLTQLGYDISSLFNMPYEDAMLKLQSGLAGELEPLRRIGYDLSVARLQQEAYTLGINKKVSAMNQAEKAELRYHAIMTQVTTSHKDMANTLDQPANQLRVLKSQINQAGRAIGNIFIPLLKIVLPYLIALAKAVRLVANEIAKLFGYKEDTNKTNWDGLSSGADDYSSALGGAVDNAKKLKQYTMGFDELNVIDPNKGSSDSGESAGGSGFNFELPEYDFMGKDTQNKVNELVGKIKDDLTIIAGLVTGIGAGLLAWKFSKSFLTGLETFTVALGLGILIDSIIATFKEGLSLKSVIEGAIGGALIGAAIGFKLGGWAGALGGIVIGIGLSLVINGITGMLADGVQVEDVATLVSGVLGTIGGVMTVIKLFNKKHKTPVPDIETATKTIDDVSTGTSKLTGTLKNLAKNLGWGIAIIAEIAIAAGIFLGAIWGIGVLLEQIGIAWRPVIDNGSQVAISVGIGTAILVAIGVVIGVLGAFSGVLLTSMALGIAVLALMSAATILFLGEIWLIGTLLAEIGIAWAPVLADGENIATAIGIGTALLVAIGVVTAALGVATVASVGLLPLAIGLGTALLLELGVATALFLIEIVKIGEYLLQVGEGWQPVLDNGATIEAGISKATDLLIAIGVVTAALGVASVASVGLLPLAIGLGTALLVELAEAFIKFCTSLKKVANKLRTDLHPALSKLNTVLPELSKNMSNFTDFMQEFAEEAVSYTASSAISGLASTIGDIISFFVDDPIESLAKDVNKQYEQATKLNGNLKKANPELKIAITNMKTYKSRIDDLKGIVDTINTSDLATNGFTNLVTIGGHIADFGGKMKSYYEKIKAIKVATMDNMVNCINDVIDFAVRIKNNVDIDKLDDFTDAIKRLTEAVRNLPTSKTLTITAIYKTSGTTPNAYATGGYPQVGEYFLAREAGPELVGSIGRKTAVVNNDQIVESISYGVASANEESNSLLREQNSLLRAMLAKESGVYLDGKQITKSVENHQRERGRVLVTGGAY